MIAYSRYFVENLFLLEPLLGKPDKPPQPLATPPGRGLIWLTPLYPLLT